MKCDDDDFNEDAGDVVLAIRGFKRCGCRRSNRLEPIV